MRFLVLIFLLSLSSQVLIPPASAETALGKCVVIYDVPPPRDIVVCPPL